MRNAGLVSKAYSFKTYPFWLPLLATLGCVSARMSDQEVDNLFRRSEYAAASKRLEKGLDEQGPSGRDSLLYLLDLGLTEHTAGNYAQSNAYFSKADKMADFKDYTSISAELVSTVSSENLKEYKGEDFEKVLINSYMAMNYALLSEQENALVEVRRVNHKLDLMVSEGKRHYKQSAFAHYLSALLYEAEGSFDEAYIDYKAILDLKPDLPSLGLDLWRSAHRLGLAEDKKRWVEEFTLTLEQQQKARADLKNHGLAELVIFYENGLSPKKIPNPSFNEIPKFTPRFNPVRSAIVYVNDHREGETMLLDDIEEMAIQNLEEKYAALITKKIAGVLAKEGISYGIGRATKSPLLGFASRVFLYASDQADLRSWNLLPRDLQVFRLLLPQGLARVHLELAPGGGRLSEKVVQLQAGKKVFLGFRYIP